MPEKVLDVQEHIAPERIITLADAYHTNLTNVSGAGHRDRLSPSPKSLPLF